MRFVRVRTFNMTLALTDSWLEQLFFKCKNKGWSVHSCYAPEKYCFVKRWNKRTATEKERD